MSTITTRKQAIQEGLRDGYDAAMDVYHHELTIAQEQAVLNGCDVDDSGVLALLRSNTVEHSWLNYAPESSAIGKIPHRWRSVYEKALCRGGVRQSRSLLKDHEAGLLAVDLGDE